MAAVSSPVSPGRSYIHFLNTHRRLIGFGLLTATLSGFGQTFFIGLFNPNLRQTFDLGHGQVGLIYGAATLASAVLLTYSGRLYDRAPLSVFLSAAALVLALGCVLMAGAHSLVLLFLALMLLRHGGQGLMGHISQTSMARFFFAGRGKALSFAALGFTLAEATFPPIAVEALELVDWRGVWLLAAAAVLALFLPVLLWLLRASGEQGEAPSGDEVAPERDWNVRQALKDRRFLLVLPAAVAGPLVVTVVFFHLVPLAAQKGWPLELMALGLSMFAVGHVVGLLGAGPLVDRFQGAGTITPALAPMLLSFVMLAGLQAEWAALVWPALLGVGMGVAQPAANALLAELYGASHLGGIRALLQSAIVVSTAVGPPIIGIVLDLGLSVEAIALVFAAGVALAAGLAWLAVGRSHASLYGRPD